MIKLEREHKIAFARIITDLIEADFIVEPEEMTFFEQIISKEALCITDTMLAEAKKIDFAKALSTLGTLDSSSRTEIVEILKKLSISDGVSVPQEAIIILAVEQVLMHNATLYSIPQPNIGINNHKVIYIEDEESEATRQIENNIQHITQELYGAGFDFIYIPLLAKEFSAMDKSYLEKVIKYMLPSLPQERIALISNNLRELTTSKFCHNLLAKKLGIRLTNNKPSLLIKVNDSNIISRYNTEDTERICFCNFLQIELESNILEQISKLTAGYTQNISHRTKSEKKLPTTKFIYTGFHRTLFDLIAFGHEQKEFRLVFEVNDRRVAIYFESTNDDKERIVLKLNPQETALYYMIAKKSVDGEGLDWREHIPPAEKSILLDEYNQIYRKTGKANNTTEYKNRIQVHHIKNRIRALQHIANAQMFIPTHHKQGNSSLYRIHASENFITIIDNTTL